MRATSCIERAWLVVALALLVPAWGCQRSAPPADPPGAGNAPAPSDTETGAEPSASEAADVIRAYYRAINERRFDDAYRCWASDGAASGKSLEAFRNGFANTASVEVALGSPGPVEGAAGSRYIEIPAQVVAITGEGGRQVFIGKYTLRRAVVDGATPAQRTWRIYSAQIRQEQ